MGLLIEKGNVFDIKRFAIDDGPGIRTTVFFKGCPLRCWWCHNPEGQIPRPELMYKRSRCVGCGECVKRCPKGAISQVAERMSINRKNCDLCGKCSQKCPTEALTIIGKETSANEVMKEIQKDRIFFEESGGGVTFSGGEPLLQPDFLNSLLKECKDMNLHTAVDTSGYASRKAIDKISDKVDLFLYDIKVMDDKMHRKYTGLSNRPVLENFKRLAENGSDILARFPVVPGINDDADNVAKTAEFIASQGIEHISLLAYHRAGIEKYRSLNRNFRLERIRTPSDESLESIKEKLEAFGLDVSIGGR